MITLVQNSPQVGYSFGAVVACPFSAPLTPGNFVLLSVTYYSEAPVLSVIVGPTAGVLLATAADPVEATITQTWLVGPIVSGSPIVTFLRDDTYSNMRAQEFSGLSGAVEYAHNGTTAEPPITYPALSVAGCLAVGIVCNKDSGGDSYWVPPTGYALSLNHSNWDVDTSGASAWRVLPSAAGATVTWGTAPGPSGSQALVILTPTPEPTTQRNTFFGISP